MKDICQEHNALWMGTSMKRKKDVRIWTLRVESNETGKPYSFCTTPDVIEVWYKLPDLE